MRVSIPLPRPRQGRALPFELIPQIGITQTRGLIDHMQSLCEGSLGTFLCVRPEVNLVLQMSEFEPIRRWAPFPGVHVSAFRYLLALRSAFGYIN